MKRLIALFLALMLVFSVSLALTACGDSDKDSESCEHVDKDKDNKCDECGKDMSKKPSDKPGNLPVDTEEGAILTDAIIAQLNVAASVKLDIEFSLLGQMEEWYYNSDNAAEKENDYIDGTATVTVTVSKSNSGVNAKVDVTSKAREDSSAPYETMMSFTALYLVDGKIYVYDEYLNAYVEEALPEMDEDEIAEAIAMLEMLMQGIEPPTDDQIDELKGVLGGLLIAVFSIDEDGGSLAVDAKPVIDALINYVVGIDADTKTVEDILNDILALVDDQIKVADIVKALKDAAGLTVNEALAEIDKVLTEQAGTTLQGLYDALVNDPQIVQLSKNMLKMQGMTDTEINSTIAEIQSMKIADMITASDMGDVTLIELIALIMAEEHYDYDGDGICNDCGININEIVRPTPDELIAGLFGEIEAVLAFTVSDIENLATGGAESSYVAMIQKILDDFVLNELNDTVSIEFSEGYNVKEITEETNVDFVLTVPSQIENKNNVLDIDAQLKIKLHSISGTKIDIALPKDATVLSATPNADSAAAKANLEANGYTVQIEDVSSSAAESGIEGATFALMANDGYDYCFIYYFESEEAANVAFSSWLEEAFSEIADIYGMEYEYIGCAGNAAYLAYPDFIYATQAVFAK